MRATRLSRRIRTHVREDIDRQRDGGEQADENERPTDPAACAGRHMVGEKKADAESGRGAGSDNERELGNGQKCLSHTCCLSTSCQGGDKDRLDRVHSVLGRRESDRGVGRVLRFLFENMPSGYQVLAGYRGPFVMPPAGVPALAVRSRSSSCNSSASTME